MQGLVNNMKVNLPSFGCLYYEVLFLWPVVYTKNSGCKPSTKLKFLESSVAQIRLVKEILWDSMVQYVWVLTPRVDNS